MQTDTISKSPRGRPKGAAPDLASPLLDGLWTEEEIARATGRKRRTVRKWLDKKMLPCVYLGGLRLVPIAEARAQLFARARASLNPATPNPKARIRRSRP
jgi:hypothetical protein